MASYVGVGAAVTADGVGSEAARAAAIDVAAIFFFEPLERTTHQLIYYVNITGLRTSFFLLIIIRVMAMSRSSRITLLLVIDILFFFLELIVGTSFSL